MILEERAVEGEKKVSILEQEIAQLTNLKCKLESKLKKEQEISERYKQDIEQFYSNLDSPLSTAITNLMIARYTRYNEEKMAKDILKVVTNSEFLSGECASLIFKKVSSQLQKNNIETENIPLRTYIEDHYLPFNFKSGTHASTKAGHIFNKLCTSAF